ncbi:MAG: fasciclin domain-containing protein, partial [Anaerolineae bacterium]|nr:fasciclin domain-containing protein [Anaerolineae bacterium]
MRKLKLLLPLLLFLLYFPAQAQGGLLSVINSDAQFSLLAQAIESADPSVEQLLSGGSNVTLLAPNDTAFENLASFLDMDLDLLFAQESIITDLLLYHILPGALFSPQLTTQYDGSVLPTYLENAFVNVDVLADGTIQLNDAVEIIFPDQSVGGSVLHVVNDVLLNRVITRQLDDFVNEGNQTVTPSATDDATSDETRVRILNAASSLEQVSVSLGDVLIVEELPFGAASEFVMVEPGSQTAQFADDATQQIDVQGLMTLILVTVDGEPTLLPINQSA